MTIEIGNKRVYRSRSGKRWIIQIRTQGRGLAAALGVESQWSYEGHHFETLEEAEAYLRAESEEYRGK